ncbi:PREDICTED: uncharacterized protein LOC109461694 isoform X3 [Branchiostoma belcheri]|uniref:Uncharacterized protein LOC109461694 isoform X2 n=1 Tax=Branchiostoma belcheri TaxID=7741 RepID=A0A6P4XSH9_BRABE|nr:PREDICTED: uncharacterized protein LOC109461694 isoform X2 [Branchiostoma belcheri]XP_019613639.1 PREDICTED: uncharacterized protein LOC109461694 isoform X3 [Branchiostoma belcheri]
METDGDGEDDVAMATAPVTVMEVMSETESSGVQLSDDTDSGQHPNDSPVRTSVGDEGIAMETREGPVTIQVEDGEASEEETSFMTPANEDSRQEEYPPERLSTPLPLRPPSSLPGSGRSTPLGNIPLEDLTDVETPRSSPRRLAPLSPPEYQTLPLAPLRQELRPATAASVSLVTVTGAGAEDSAAPSDQPPSYHDVLPSYEAVMAQGEEPLETWRLMGVRPSQVVMETSFGPTISTAVSARRTDLPENTPQTEPEITSTDLDVEVASPRQPERRFPWLTRRVKGLGLSVRTLLISLFVGLCALLLVGLLPPSFSYVDYYHYGLTKQRTTGAVNTKVVYGPGRHVIGPDFEFKLFPRGAHMVRLNDLAIFTSDLLEVIINCSFQHFLRKDEVGLLHDKFDLDYEPVLYRVAYSTIKETATLYSTENFMSSRPEIEAAFLQALRDRLQGDCCTGDNSTQPAFCRPPPDCDMGYHTDVRYFQLLSVTLPAQIVELSMTALTLQIDAEKEQFIQDNRVTRKVTEAMRQSILNQADQIRANGTARAGLVLSRAYAQSNQTTEMSHINGLQLMYENLNITEEEEKASLHWIRTLEKHPRLYTGISFQDFVRITQRTQP